MDRQADPTRPIKVAVVTGGHPFDVRGFHRMFRSLAGIDAYVQHMEDFSTDPAGLRGWYDVVVFYNMPPATPTGEGPWHESKTLAALEALGETPQGILVLHHAVLAYPDWPMWAEMVGIADRRFTFHMDQNVRIEVADAGHPITAGLGGWEMIDETYGMADAGEGCHVLLTTDHPKSLKTLAWTKTHKRAPVFCFQSGHDDRAYAHPNFRQVLQRGIHWLAEKGSLTS